MAVGVDVRAGVGVAVSGAGVAGAVGPVTDSAGVAVSAMVGAGTTVAVDGRAVIVAVGDSVERGVGVGDTSPMSVS